MVHHWRRVGGLSKGNGINLNKTRGHKAHWILCRKLLTGRRHCYPEHLCDRINSADVENM